LHTRALNVQLLATLHVQSHYTELQRALEARGFRVVRMDTYDSVIVQWSGDQHALAAAADVVALASPSAIRVSQGRARERAHTQERAHTLAGNSRLSWMSLLLSRLLACSLFRCVRQTWADRVGTETKVACFGKKSESTCLSLGFTKLFVSSGGMQGWADAVQSALRSSCL
jgi:uroporphyrinogen-III synthase